MLTIGSIDHASSRLRALEYIPLIEEYSDISVSWIPRVAAKRNQLLQKYFLSPLLKRYYFLKRVFCILFYNWDIIFIQRLFLSSFEINALKKRNSKIIFDFDDAIYSASVGGDILQTESMLKIAGEVIVSAPELMNFCNQRNINAHLITTPVNTNMFFPGAPKNKNKIIIGWTGSASTTKYLNIIKSPLQKLSKELDFELVLVGADKNFIFENVIVKKYSWQLEKEPDYIREMDIGVMPLIDDEWAKGKGGYKLFTYMASAIPVIASPVGINSAIVEHGVNGYLAGDENEWIKYLGELLSDKDKRIKMGQAGLQKVKSQYSQEKCFDQLIKILN